MNEVKRIHLGRQQFTISLEAHKALRDYLTAIEKQTGDSSEVGKEVEMRMAELLSERGISGEKVVLQEDVDFLKRQLGEPRDFKDDSTGTPAETPTNGQTSSEETQPKRLFRDTEHGLIAGVASGLAAYIGIDVLLVRIAFIALTFASGAGLLLYILIWLLAPEAKTPSDRLQMQGKAVTVDTLKEMVDRADIAGAGQRAGRNFAPVAGRALAMAVRAVAGVVGAFFVISGFTAGLVAIAAGVYALVHGAQAGSAIIFPFGTREVWLVILASVATVLVGFFCLVLGLMMTGAKWRLPGWLTAVLVGFFLVSAGVSTALAFDTVPKVQDRYRQQRHSVQHNLPAFSKVELDGEETNFEFRPDTAYSVEFSYVGDTDPQLLKAAVEAGVLKLNSQDFMNRQLCSGFCFDNYRDLKVIIHAPTLEEVSLSGHENHFRVEEQLSQPNIVLKVRRYDENTMVIFGTEAAAADFEEPSARHWTLRLEGIRPSAHPELATVLNDDNPTVQIGAAETFHWRTFSGCQEDEPFVHLTEVTKSIQVGEDGTTLLHNAGELRERQNSDGHNAYNCLSWNER